VLEVKWKWIQSKRSGALMGRGSLKPRAKLPTVVAPKTAPTTFASLVEGAHYRTPDSHVLIASECDFTYQGGTHSWELTSATTPKTPYQFFSVKADGRVFGPVPGVDEIWKRGKKIRHEISLVNWTVADLVRVEKPKDG
jgi:hypothetical protein